MDNDAMTEFEKIAADCRAAADFYLEKPGMAERNMPRVIIDLYRTMQSLAEAADKASRHAVLPLRFD